jgi:hypothetical protein
MKNPVLLAYGGGTNSTAIICGYILKNIDPPDLILFADTGGEKPHTYDHINELNSILPRYGFPLITVVKKVDKHGNILTLEEDCIRRNTLPSIAFGFKSCSQKFKIAPQDKFCNNYAPFKKHWKSGGLVTKLIGYDFSETRRWMKSKVEDKKYRYEFPLVEWEWDRQACVDAILKLNILLPGKSACYFCPSSKKPELDQLKIQYPELLDKAIFMENNAKSKLTSIKGLGRSFSWSDYVNNQVTQLELFEHDRTVCGVCVDYEE